MVKCNRCQAYTSKGKRCKNKISCDKKCWKYCWIHSPTKLINRKCGKNLN